MMPALRLFISLALIVWVVQLADITALKLLWDRLDSTILLLVILFVLATMLTGLWRWWFILCRTGLLTSFYVLLPGYFVGVFFNNIMPVTIGGDIARTVYLHRRGFALQPLVTSAILDRWFGLLSILFVVAITSLLWPHRLGLIQDVFFLVALISVAGMGVIYSLSRKIGKFNTSFKNKTIESVLAWIVMQFDYFVKFRQSFSFIVSMVLLSAFSQGFVLMAYYLLGRSLGVTIPFVDYLVVVPAIMLLQTLPVSAAGLGVREAASVWLFTVAGVSQQHAVLMSVMMLGALWVVAVPGGLVALFGRWTRRM